MLAGFLPPENGTGRGKGYISYTIQTKAGLATGTQIRNVAVVTFDFNDPIATDQVSETDPAPGVDPNKQALVTIDAVGHRVPQSPHFPPRSTGPFLVSWSGQDDVGGSGIGSYDVYVSDDGGPYTIFQSDTPRPRRILPARTATPTGSIA